jgi:DNA repair exonuclease SbcCD ATPase subunit
MKVLGLHAENFKMLKVVDITPDENFQIISGKNEQGKSSVIDSLWAAIKGKDALKNVDEPIRHGAEKAVIRADLGELIVTRKFTKSGTTLEVSTKDGAAYKSPQAVLDALVGNLSFDPLQFSLMESKKQVEVLQKLVGYDPAALDAERDKLYNERTMVNRDVKTLEVMLESMLQPSEDISDEEVSISAILAEKEQAEKLKKSNDEKRKDYAAVTQQWNVVTDEVARLNDEIKKLTEQREQQVKNLEQITEKGKQMSDEVEKLKDPDLETFNTKLKDVEKTNQSVRAKQEHKKVSEALAEVRKTSADFTAKIADIDKKKENQLKAAKFPIEGLGFNEHGVTLKDVPLKQSCDSQQMKVSMAIAMAFNPDLRVIRINNGSLLDSENLKLIQEMAKDKDFQVWVEVIDESGTMGVVIEDGEVKQNVTNNA